MSRKDWLQLLIWALSELLRRLLGELNREREISYQLDGDMDHAAVH